MDARARHPAGDGPPGRTISFDACAMDGIAVLAAETVGASETTPLLLPPEDYDVVNTGDVLPARRDAVVMREQVHHVDAVQGVGGAQGIAAELRAAAVPYQHVRSVGEDVATGELLLPAGHRLRPVAAAAAGATDLLVRRRPHVVVLPTGDEVRPVGSPTMRQWH